MNAIVGVAMDNLPSIADAKLPSVYRNAVTALEQATKIDECQSWADKAMALASYARQSRDDTLCKMAVRIQNRASRRCGELLAQVPRNPGGSPTHKATRVGVNPSSPSSEFVTDGLKHVDGIYAAGHDAKMSTGQIKTALRVAAVPEDVFEEQVESDDPPSVTKMAEQGTKPRPKPLIDLEGIKPQNFRDATELGGLLHRLEEFCNTHDPAQVAQGFKAHECVVLRAHITAAGHWLRAFADHLPEGR
ncbi:hypothetical protein AWB80_02859 [Caballeronia pedi]|uniref:Uncharacterized protein n=1 Tax=Caballeronia pedi TaxID=1777141 RepID=A0A158B087_9BURK|nr:hypothetical protein [Caballeronia pedi]SAK63389.1 hypothetical protein AWB80_02859 [Caballeronia pedi]